jgi:hypothetical protein
MLSSAIRMPRYVVPQRIQTAIQARYAVRMRVETSEGRAIALGRVAGHPYRLPDGLRVLCG